MAKRRRVGNVLALTLLSTLVQRPMYPYEMVSALRAHGKDQSRKIHWGSLYTVVQNLEKHGLIQSTGTTRQGRQPERTVYEITDAGRAELKDWLRELLSVPEREYPRFEAALSEAAILPPGEVATLLEQRLNTLEAQLAAGTAEIGKIGRELPRVFLIEGEFHLAMLRAEADWVRALLEDIARGAVSGLPEWRAYHETGRLPPDIAEMAERGLAEQPSSGRRQPAD